MSKIIQSKNELEELYKNLKTIEAVCKNINTTRPTLIKKFKELNIKYNHAPKPSIYLSREELEKIYIEFDSIVKLAKHLNVGKNYISKKLKEYNISTKYYESNENFFSKENSDSYYWAGFIGGDGNINKQKNRLSIKIHTKDVNHLFKFKEAINSTSPIQNIIRKDSRPQCKQKEYYSSNIYISSKNIINDLANNFNIGPNKSLTYSIPNKVLESKYFFDFLRGMLDADGFISKNLTQAGICGSNESMNQIYNKLLTLDIKTRIFKKGKISGINCASKSNLNLLLNNLYKDSKYYLDRKYELYLQYKGKNGVI